MFYYWYNGFQNSGESVVGEPQEGQPNIARNKILQNTVAVIV